MLSITLIFKRPGIFWRWELFVPGLLQYLVLSLHHLQHHASGRLYILDIEAQLRQRSVLKYLCFPTPEVHHILGEFPQGAGIESATKEFPLLVNLKRDQSVQLLDSVVDQSLESGLCWDCSVRFGSLLRRWV